MSKQQSNNFASFAIDNSEGIPADIISLSERIYELSCYIADYDISDNSLDLDQEDTKDKNAIEQYRTELTAAFQKDTMGEEACRSAYEDALMEIPNREYGPMNIFLDSHKEVKECIERNLLVLEPFYINAEELANDTTATFFPSSFLTQSPSGSTSFHLDLSSLSSLPLGVNHSIKPLPKKPTKDSYTVGTLLYIRHNYGSDLLRDLAQDPHAVTAWGNQNKHKIDLKEEESSKYNFEKIPTLFSQLKPSVMQAYLHVVEANDQEALSLFLEQHNTIRQILTDYSTTLTSLADGYPAYLKEKDNLLESSLAQAAFRQQPILKAILPRHRPAGTNPVERAIAPTRVSNAMNDGKVAITPEQTVQK